MNTLNRAIWKLGGKLHCAGFPSQFPDKSNGLPHFVRRLGILLFAAFFLVGCADYDLGVNVYHDSAGEIVQQLTLNDRLTTFSPVIADQWFAQLEQKAKTFQGQSQRLAPNVLEVRVPFSSGSDLVEKFNQLFKAPAVLDRPQEQPAPEITAQAHLTQKNRWLVLRNHLQLDLDLRSLGVLIAQGEALVSSGDLFDLQFHLKTPWGAKDLQGQIRGAQTSIPVAVVGKQVTWALQPGQVNHLEAVFWVPSPVGISSLVLVFLAIAASWLRQQMSILLDPDPDTEPT